MEKPSINKVGKLYESYKEQVQKDNNIGYVRMVKRELIEEGFLLEKAGRTKIEYDAGTQKAFVVIDDKINPKIAEMISEIALYGGFPTNFKIVIETKATGGEIDKSKMIGDDLLDPLGFHIFEKGDADERYIEADFIVAKHGTTMAFICFIRPKENSKKTADS